MENNRQATHSGCMVVNSSITKMGNSLMGLLERSRPTLSLSTNPQSGKFLRLRLHLRTLKM